MVKLVSTIFSKKDSGPTLTGKLILIAWGITSTIPYGILIGWPFLIVGIIFIVFSDLPRREKWLWVAIPAVIWLPLVVVIQILLNVLMACYNYI